MPILNASGKTIVTANEALDYIAKNPSISSADLKQLALQMDTKVSGNVSSVLLYSGGLDDVSTTQGLKSASNGDIAKLISQNSVAANKLNSAVGKVATIDLTEAGKLISDLRFLQGVDKALAKDMGLDINNPANKVAIQNATNNTLYGVTENGVRIQNGLWDTKSVDFINNNVTDKTPVKALTVTANPDRVFSQSEVDAILKSKAPSIDGAPKTDYDAIYNRS